MTDIRKAKIDRISIPDQIVELGAEGGKLAVVGWGSPFGPIHQAVRRKRAEGQDVAHIHIRHVWPLPGNLGDLLKRSAEHTSALESLMGPSYAVFCVKKKQT